MQNKELKIIKENSKFIGERLDKALIGFYPEKSRNFFQNIIDLGNVSVNGTPKKSNYRIREGDEIIIFFPEEKDLEILPADIPIDILYEDCDVVVVNKPKNMVVHPAPGHFDDTLVNALLYYLKDDLSTINGVRRPGIVHRIDKDTTGALIVCKNDKAHNIIASQIKDHQVKRKYFGFVKGIIKEDDGRIESTIGRNPKNRLKMAMNVPGGKIAITNYHVEERFFSQNATYMTFELQTGRTHQIRVHMAGIGHPLMGDLLYGNGKDPYHLEGQALHAGKIGFIRPSDGKYIEVDAPLPQYFERLSELLRKE